MEYTMKRIIALVLSVILVAICLTSCDLIATSKVVDAEEAKAEFLAAIEALEAEDGYVTEMKVDFSSESEEMSETISALGGTGITVWRSGENVKTRLNVLIGDDKITKTFIAIDDMLYSESIVYVGDEALFLKECADFTDADVSMILQDAGAGVGVSLDDFATVSATEIGGKLTIIGTEMDKSAAASLANILKGRFSGSGASVIVSDEMIYTAVIAEGKISSTSIACQYTVIIGGETYVIDAVISEKYSYKDVAIEAPADADSYTVVALENLIK